MKILLVLPSFNGKLVYLCLPKSCERNPHEKKGECRLFLDIRVKRQNAIGALVTDFHTDFMPVR